MFRSLSTGEVIDPDWTQFSFPTRWHYDVLWGLDYLRQRRRRTRLNGSPRPSIWWRRSRTATGDGRSRTPTPVRPTSTWKTWQASPAAGTHSAHCECWTGIRTERQRRPTRRSNRTSLGCALALVRRGARLFARHSTTPPRLFAESSGDHDRDILPALTISFWSIVSAGSTITAATNGSRQLLRTRAALPGR